MCFEGNPVNNVSTPDPVTLIARINAQPLHAHDEKLDAATLRQRACTELLRQAAQAEGLLTVEDRAPTDGALSQAASEAVERLLELKLQAPEPDDDACRRHHAAHPGRYRRDERLHMRHVLFAVTPGVDLTRLRGRAEQVLLELRADGAGTLFAQRAAELSNCPSSSAGGDLGWLRATDCAPEFAREVFGQAHVGVLARLVHSRFGLHVVEVLAREGGEALPYEQVQSAVRLALQQHSWATALRQYLSVLAGQAKLEGVSLDAADGPLVQ